VEASQSTFAPVVVESALEEGHVPAIKLEIAIGDVVLRTEHSHRWRAAVRVIRAVRASDDRGGADLKIYIATRPIDFRCGHDGLRRRWQEMLASTRSAAQPSCSIETSDRIKILVWDRKGLVLVHKRLEGCKFVWPTDRRRRDAHIASDVRSPVRRLDWRLVARKKARRPRALDNLRQIDRELF